MEKIVREIYDAMSKGDIDFLDQIFADDMKYIGATNTVYDKDVFLREMPINKSAFPDQKYNVERVITRDDVAVVEYTWTATHTGEYRGYPPTNSKIVLPVVDILEFESGKVKVFKDIYNWKIFEKGYNLEVRETGLKWEQ